MIVGRITHFYVLFFRRIIKFATFMKEIAFCSVFILFAATYLDQVSHLQRRVNFNNNGIRLIFSCCTIITQIWTGKWGHASSS